MKKIILISDTHSYLGKDVTKYFDACDEIWHAGDIGSMEVLDQLETYNKKLRIVYGNIDNKEIQECTDYNLIFDIDGLKVLITHIGGYPGRYTKRVKKLLENENPNVYVCGHSHILKVMPDKELGLIHMNPGACGIVGVHKFRTFLQFDIKDGKIENLNAIDLGPRGSIQDNA